MFILRIISINSKNEHQECCLGDFTLENTFDMLTALVKIKCQLISVHLIEGLAKPILLPVEAFDGEPMSKSLKKLQQEWEEILLHE
jgi:hypothetical protein